MSVLDLFRSSVFQRAERYAQSRCHTTFLDVVIPYNDKKTIQPAKCQRELCWSLEQYGAYVTHCLITNDAGAFILYRHEEDINTTYILDGQHRIHAWRMFISGELTLSHEGREIAFSDFTEQDVRLLTNRLTCTVQFIKTSDSYDTELTEYIYNLFNFTGVAHKKGVM